MNVQSIIRIGLAATSLAGCAFEPDQARDGALEGRRVLAELQAGELHFAASHEGDPMPLVEPAVTGGTIVVRTAGEHLLLEELVLELGDVDVTKQLGSSTQVLHLTDLRLRLGTRGDAIAAWTDDHVWGVASADLLLDWSLRATDGAILPLATQRIRAAELDVHLQLEAGAAATASVTSTTPGLLWKLGDITVSDLSLSLVTGELP
jgi:hypothetical protein